MAKVGAAASVKKKQQNTSTATTGTAMTPQNTTVAADAYTPVNYPSTPAQNYANSMAGKAVNQRIFDIEYDMLGAPQVGTDYDVARRVALLNQLRANNARNAQMNTARSNNQGWPSNHVTGKAAAIPRVYLSDYQLGKNIAEEDMLMDDDRLRRMQLDDFLHNNPDIPGSAARWPSNVVSGRRADGSTLSNQNYYDLWLLANGIRF